jgi:hypothetical protein
MLALLSAGRALETCPIHLADVLTLHVPTWVDLVSELSHVRATDAEGCP